MGSSDIDSLSATVTPAALADGTAGMALFVDGPTGKIYSNSRTYAPEAGIGSTATPFSGSIDEFARRIVSFQSSQAANATRDAEAQQVVASSLQERFDAETGVNIDDEMSNLLLLQNAYSANARVISTIQDLFNVLMSIGR